MSNSSSSFIFCFALLRFLLGSAETFSEMITSPPAKTIKIKELDDWLLFKELIFHNIMIRAIAQQIHRNMLYLTEILFLIIKFSAVFVNFLVSFA